MSVVAIFCRFPVPWCCRLSITLPQSKWGKQNKSSVQTLTTQFLIIDDIWIIFFWTRLLVGGKSSFTFTQLALYLFWRDSAHAQLTEPNVSHKYTHTHTPRLLSQRHCWTRTALPPSHQTPGPPPASSSCLFLSLPLLFYRFLSALQRQLLWRMSGLKQYAVVRVTPSTDSVCRICCATAMHGCCIGYNITNVHKPSGSLVAIAAKSLTHFHT